MERDAVYVSRGGWGAEGEGAGERDSVRKNGRVTERKKRGERTWRKWQREEWPGWHVVQGNEGARKRRQRDGKGAGLREAGEQESVGS